MTKKGLNKLGILGRVTEVGYNARDFGKGNKAALIANIQVKIGRLVKLEEAEDKMKELSDKILKKEVQMFVA